jgi:hypothetical protein
MVEELERRVQNHQVETGTAKGSGGIAEKQRNAAEAPAGARQHGGSGRR